MKVTASITTGMPSQNNTPPSLIPFLKRFNKQIWWGDYIIVVGVATKAVAANRC